MGDMAQDYDYDLDEDETMSKSQLKRLATLMEDENKKLVLSVHPDAYTEDWTKQKYNSAWWVFISNNSWDIGKGNTEALAWADAVKRIKEQP